jgi:DNA-binding beta-propeller fold protein YncE
MMVRYAKCQYGVLGAVLPILCLLLIAGCGGQMTAAPSQTGKSSTANPLAFTGDEEQAVATPRDKGDKQRTDDASTAGPSKKQDHSSASSVERPGKHPLAAPPPGEGTGEGTIEQPPDDPPSAGKKKPNQKNPKEDPLAADDDTEHPFPRRVKAPSLDGGLEWLNAAGPVDIKDLKGKWVLLDFWCYCCINCMHVLPELKKLEKAHPNDLVVIGVHSAKFDTEKGTKNIREAILRYEIEHPVVNDAEHKIWDEYGASSWPSLRLIDPEGNLVAGHNGEIDAEALEAFLKKFTPYYRKKGVLNTTPLVFKRETLKATPLRFPGKVLADAAGDRLFIADSNHNRIVIAKLDGTLLEVVGSGQMGAKDGDYKTAEFKHPQGMALKGEALYVADTGNHNLRKIDLAKRQVTTIAGKGRQRREHWPGIKFDDDERAMLGERFVGKPRDEALASPWDLWIHGEDLYIAMAGPHQIWKMTLDEKEIGPYAGNGREDIVDGPLLPKRPFQLGFSSLAQPSGLTSDGEWLYVADSEGSSIRAVPFDAKREVRTVVGTADLPANRLFTFGDVDGAVEKALLQHCLGVAYHDGKLYVADTYNDKVKELDLKAQTIKTIAGAGKPGFSDDPPLMDEPAGISAAAGKLFVADTNNHAIRVIDLKNGNKVTTLAIKGLQPPDPPKTVAKKPSFPGAKRVELPKTVVKAVDAKITLAVELQLPDGWKINADGPMAYLIEAEGDAGPIDRAAIGNLVYPKERQAKFDIAVPVRAATGQEKLTVSLTYYYCQKKETGLCKVGSVIWTVPLEVTERASVSSAPLKYVVEGADGTDKGKELGKDFD